MHALMQLPFAELLDIDLPAIFGGHTGYGTGPSREPSGAGDDDGSIGAGTIIAVLALGIITVVLLYSLSSSATKAKMKSFAPLAVLVAIIVVPLLVWTTASGGDDKSLIVERSTSNTGAPELIVSLEEDLNTLKTTNGKRAVRLECLDRDGEVVLDAEQRWPFRSREKGYAYPHTHQRATLKQRQRANRCRLKGTRVQLETDVEGALTG
jgi:hypothetical protein